MDPPLHSLRPPSGRSQRPPGRSRVRDSPGGSGPRGQATGPQQPLCTCLAAVGTSCPGVGLPVPALRRPALDEVPTEGSLLCSQCPVIEVFLSGQLSGRQTDLISIGAAEHGDRTREHGILMILESNTHLHTHAHMHTCIHVCAHRGPCTCTTAHTPPHAHAETHAHVPTLTQTHARMHTHMHVYTHRPRAHTETHADVPTLTQTHARMHTHTCTCTHTAHVHTRAHTCTQTHVHTHTHPHEYGAHTSAHTHPHSSPEGVTLPRCLALLTGDHRRLTHWKRSTEASLTGVCAWEVLVDSSKSLQAIPRRFVGETKQRREVIFSRSEGPSLPLGLLRSTNPHQ